MEKALEHQRDTERPRLRQKNEEGDSCSAESRTQFIVNILLLSDSPTTPN